MGNPKDELVRFVQNTSVKGLPRASKAKETPIRGLWIISTAVLLSFSVYQTYLLISMYFEYHSSTDISIRHCSELENNLSGGILPTVTGKGRFIMPLSIVGGRK